MIIGNRNEFAIEYEVTKAYDRLSFMALGYFILHIRSKTYGVRTPDATLLACSFQEVRKRIGNRGKHTTTFSSQSDSRRLAQAVYASIYAMTSRRNYLGIDPSLFRSMISHSSIYWAPDGDQAFDDGSFVLQFDIGNTVRLIGFRVTDRFRVDPRSLSDITIDQDTFYRVLETWVTEFNETWKMLDKSE